MFYSARDFLCCAMLTFALTPLCLHLTEDSGFAAQRSLYVTSQTTNKVVQYPINTDGTLGNLASEAATGNSPRGIVISPDGKSAYVTNTLSGTISQFTLDVDGKISEKTTAVAAVAGISGITITPNGKYLYAANGLDGKVYQFTINSDGTLTAMTTPSVNSGTGAVQVVTSPNSDYLYVAHDGVASIRRFTIDTNGALTAPTDYNTGGTQAKDLAFSPNFKTLYVSHGAADIITSFTVDSSNGVPSNMQARSSLQFNMTGLIISPDSKSLYTMFNGLMAGSGGVIQADIQQADASLLGKFPYTLPLPASGLQSIVLTPDGKNAYGTSLTDGIVYPFNVNQTSGTLSVMTGSILPGAKSLAVSPVVGPTAKLNNPATTELSAPNTEITFDASTSISQGADIVNYDWDFGDGTQTTSTTAQIKHTFTQPGAYIVKLTVHDSANCGKEVVTTGRTTYCSGQAAPTTTRVVSVLDPNKPIPPPDPNPNPNPNPAVKKCVVPQLKLNTLKQAKTKLTKANCLLGKVKKPKRKPRKRGLKLLVTQQSQKAGKSLSINSKVNLTLSWQKPKKGKR